VKLIEIIVLQIFFRPSGSTFMAQGKIAFGSRRWYPSSFCMRLAGTLDLKPTGFTCGRYASTI
jgi:hypothetical protein